MNFKEIISSDKPVLVDFSAEWCGPCKQLAPILEQVKSKVGETAKIVKIDVDRNRKVADQFQIRSVPTMILFKDGKSVWRQSGVQPAHVLENLIKQYSK
ncbi:thioredoxin [Sandaracinomonas limnophila]|uniref:Thioredoxin n=1 Tax=Sandaracinomonas limnophila TaxID=1862386 RepID=A0A437PXN8_9BACT|nr:thioredoxin [Sandaracinomonas limnophila]RVU27025.1 thioredoxin [Sandaracinomonas limnophila]